MFRYKKALGVSYERQGYIYFLSRRYAELPAWQQERIRQLCDEAGGEYSAALMEFVTTDRGATEICMEHYLSEATLHRLVKKYYEGFPKKL